MNYKQCLLENGNKVRIAWIPAKYSCKGNTLKLQDEDGWIVKSVYGVETEENLKAVEHDYKKWAVKRGLKK